jgi:hypothetical protein
MKPNHRISFGCFGEHRQAIIDHRPPFLSKSFPQVFLSLIPER